MDRLATWLVSIGLAAVVALGASSGAWAQEQEAPPAEPRSEAPKASAANAKNEPTWYVAAFGKGDSGFLITHYWSKGTRFRAETVINGHSIVTIVNGEYYYIIDPITARGVAIRRLPHAIAQDAARGRPFALEYDRIVREGGEVVDTAEVGGRMCDHYRHTDADGRRQVWVTQDARRLPVRVETYSRQTRRSEGTDYTNWLWGFHVADSFFEPSPAIELERITYEDYTRRSMKEMIGPAPALFGYFLKGERN